MKKIFMILLTTLLLTANLFAGGNKEAQSASTADSPKEITIWCWDPNFNVPVMQEAAKRFTSQNPEVNINVVEMAKADVEQKIQTILASGTTTGLPDICLVEDYNVEKYVTYYPGSFADLTSSFNYNDFTKYKTNIGVVDNKNYTVPFDSGVTGLFYRPEMLKKAGIDPSELQNITWNQFCDLAKKYKQATGEYFLATQPTDGGFLRIMLNSTGQWYFDDNGNPNVVNNAALKAGIEVYKRLLTEDLAKPALGWNEWVGATNSGDVPTMTSGIWIMGSIKAAADQSGKWDVAPTPRLDVPNSVNASNLGGSSWMVLEKSKNKTLAIKFLQDTFASDIDFYQTILVNQGAMGSYIPSLTGSAYSANDEFFSNKPIFKTMADWSKQVPSVNVGMFTYDADTAVMSNLQPYYDGKASIEDTLKAIESQLKNAML